MLSDNDYKVITKTTGVVIGEMVKRHDKLRYLKSGAIIVLADGLDNLLEMVERKMPRGIHGQSSERSGRGDFNTFDTYKEALEVFRYKPETVSDFDPAELRIRDVSESGAEVDYDVTGDYIDMGRFLEGIPETWGTMHGGQARNRRVRVMVNLNQMAGMQWQEIKHRAERVLRMVDALEQGGVRCELVAISSTECDHVEVILKRHHETLDIQDLAVALHPEFLRRVLFRIKEQSKTWDWGYGSAIDFSHKVKPDMLDSDTNDELQIFVDGNIRGNCDDVFDQAEKLLQWEMSKPVPEVSSIKINDHSVSFNANGARGSEEIKREGREVIRA